MAKLLLGVSCIFLIDTNLIVGRVLRAVFPNFFRLRTIKARIYPGGPQNCIADHFRSDLTVKLTLMSIFGHVLDPKIFPADQFMDFGGP